MAKRFLSQEIFPKDRSRKSNRADYEVRVDGGTIIVSDSMLYDEVDFSKCKSPARAKRRIKKYPQNVRIRLQSYPMDYNRHTSVLKISPIDYYALAMGPDANRILPWRYNHSEKGQLDLNVISEGAARLKEIHDGYLKKLAEFEEQSAKGYANIVSLIDSYNSDPIYIGNEKIISIIAAFQNVQAARSSEILTARLAILSIEEMLSAVAIYDAKYPK